MTYDVRFMEVVFHEGYLVQIAFTTYPFSAPTWTDVTDNCMSISIRRGRQYELDRMEAGTAMVRLKNTEGHYWPDNAAGDYYGNIKPVKRLGIRQAYDGVVYDLFEGFIESWVPKWILHPQLAPVMDVSAADLFKNLAYLEIDTVAYPQERTGARVERVLGELLWTEFDLDTGEVDVDTTDTHEAEYYENAMDHLHRVVETENGRIYIAGDGDFQFESRFHRQVNHAASLATFGDGVGDMPIYDFELEYDDQHIYNEIHVTPQDIVGDVQIVSDATSITEYGKRVLSLYQSLATSEAECLALAQYLLEIYKDPRMRAKSITIKVGKDKANLAPKAWGYEISDRITVRLTQASILGDYFIEGIEHDWVSTEPNNWTTKWQLSSTDAAIAYWMLEDANLGKLEETTKLAY